MDTFTLWGSIAIVVGWVLWFVHRTRHRPDAYEPGERLRLLRTIAPQERPPARPDGTRTSIGQDAVSPFKGSDRRAGRRQ